MLRAWCVVVVVLGACGKGDGKSPYNIPGIPGVTEKAAEKPAEPAAPPAAAPAPAPAPASAFKVGDEVDVRKADGHWYEAKIVEANVGSYNVKYVWDDEERDDVPASDVRVQTWKKGDPCEGQWSDGRWYRATIANVTADGTYDLDYDDGDTAKALPRSKVRGRRGPKHGSSHASSGGGGGDAPCPGPGLTRRCGGVCVNIQTDDNNCGGCGNQCSGGKHCDGHMSCRDADGNL